MISLQQRVISLVKKAGFPRHLPDCQGHYIASQIQPTTYNLHPVIFLVKDFLVKKQHFRISAFSNRMKKAGFQDFDSLYQIAQWPTTSQIQPQQTKPNNLPHGIAAAIGELQRKSALQHFDIFYQRMNTPKAATRDHPDNETNYPDKAMDHPCS